MARKFLRQPAARRKLLIEACLYLIWAKIILLVLPFRLLTRFFTYPASGVPAVNDVERGRLRHDIQWAIQRTAPHMPGETACFPCGIAAQAMCRRRGIDATLYYGAATLPARGLTAHVWVLDGTEGVVGHQVASDYLIIGRFPG